MLYDVLSLGMKLQQLQTSQDVESYYNKGGFMMFSGENSLAMVVWLLSDRNVKGGQHLCSPSSISKLSTSAKYYSHQPTILSPGSAFQFCATTMR